MKIDFHSHVIPQNFVAAIENGPTRIAARIEGQGEARRVVHDQGYVYPLFAEFIDVDAKLAAMDRKGLDISVLSPAPPTFSTVGLENVMGKTARTLEAQFGQPDLDIREGTARKLQFAGQVCVLDAYLYPPERGREPVVRYVDARLPDGRDVDRASCAAALTRRQEAR